MDVINMGIEIFLITTGVLPIPALPNLLLPFLNPAGVFYNWSILQISTNEGLK